MTGEPMAVRVDRRGHILLVTIDRPAVRNAIDSQTALAIGKAMDRLDAEHDLFLGIITGADGFFSAGADLSPAAQAAKAPLPDRGHFGLCRRPPNKPLIAAIEGFALGGGLEIALACDLIVAAEDARMGLPEVRHGLIPLAGGALRLPRRLPYHLAVDMVLSGEPRSAKSLAMYGLVNRLTEPGQALEEALRIADALLANGPLALAAAVRVMRTFGPTEADWDMQTQVATVLRESEDRAEGIRAFAEKRPPRWQGR